MRIEIGNPSRQLEVPLGLALTQAGAKLSILVGDEPYYARTGFRRAPAGRLQMPGPVDPARLLYCEIEPGAFEGVEGMVRGA